MTRPHSFRSAVQRAASAGCIAAAMFGPAAGQAQQSRRAVPVEDDSPPVPRAVPVQPNLNAQPRQPAASQAPRPAGPDEDLYEYASMIYERKEYPLAAQSFAQYLQRYAGGRHVAMCLFRLGECHVNQNQAAEAERFYAEVVNRYPSSEGAPSAAYRLGAMRFNTKQFAESAQYFTFCESRTTFQQIKLAAGYNKSRAYQMLGDRRKMIAALQAVAAVKKDNPYRESALLSLATALLAEDKKKEALPMFLDLVATSTDRVVVSDALVKAAVIETETGKLDDAAKHFESALNLGETTAENRGVALSGMVQILYEKKDYNAVIDWYNRNSASLPPGPMRAKLLLIVGNAHRMRKSYSRAVEMYILIEKYHPETDEAFESGYWKVYCFYLLGDKQLPDFSKAFIDKYGKDRAGSEYISLARLILADAWFNEQKYAESADAYTEVDFEKLPARLRDGGLFNKGWAEAEAARHQDAINTFTQFLADFSKHEFVPKALARRGLSYRELRDLPKAEADFSAVIKDHPQSDAVELAYLQRALIHSETRELQKMIADYESLAEKFPKSAAAAQAWYGIGRGHFEQKAFDRAVPALQKAISLDKKIYLDKASPLIVLSQFGRQDADGLAKAIDAYRDANPNASTSPNVLNWLGITLFNKGDFARSARFLTYSANMSPDATAASVWDHLGKALIELKKFDDSLAATEKFLQNAPDVSAKARGLLTKSRALLGLGRHSEAITAAEEGLQIVKAGKLQAQLLILEGDILYAEGELLASSGNQAGASAKWKESAAKCVVPSQVFLDKDITPEALYKAARALNAAGDRAKAEQFIRQLKQDYPAYKPPELTANP